MSTNVKPDSTPGDSQVPRRRMITIFVMLVAALFGTVIVAQPASAATFPYTWDYYSACDGQSSCHSIDARDSSGLAHFAVFVYNTGTGYKVTAQDFWCNDGINPKFHAHNTSGGYWSLSITANPSCGNSQSWNIPYSGIGSPKNWWVEANGTNSPVEPFPPAP